MPCEFYQKGIHYLIESLVILLNTKPNREKAGPSLADE